MQTEEIIRMAREAGCDNYGDCYEFIPETLERFATLVAAHEREVCAKFVDHILKEGGGTYGDAIRARGE